MSPPSALPAWRTLTDTRTRRRSSPPPRPPEAPFAHHRPRRSINVIFACGPPQGPPQGELERQKRILAAVVRILLAMLRASGFSLAGERLPEGAAKDGILRAITSAKPLLPLAVILRMVHLEPGRYHAWNRRGAALACGLDDRSSCPRTSPSQLTPSEVATVKGMVLAPEYRHMPLGTLARYAQRIGKVFASASTWTKLVRERGWRRPRQRVHPPKPTVGVRASQPNQIWHIDTSVIKLLDGTKVYLQAVLDNYSRKILAWTVMERFAPSNTCQLLLAAGKHLVTASRPLLYADSGVENVNGVRGPLVYPDAVHVEVRPRPAQASAGDAVVPLSGRVEVAGLAEVLSHHRFVQLHAQAGGVRNRDVAFVNERLRHAGDQLLPPGEEIHGMALHGNVGIQRGGGMNGGDGGQRRSGHVNGRGDALAVEGVIGNPFGLAATTGGAVIQMDDIDGAIVDQLLEAFLQAETVLAREQRRAGMSLDFLELLPSARNRRCRNIFQPCEAALLERLGGANAIGDGSAA